MSVLEALKTAGCSVNKGCAANLPDTAETGTIGLGKKDELALFTLHKKPQNYSVVMESPVDKEKFPNKLLFRNVD
jgi:hypothetical protein